MTIVNAKQDETFIINDIEMEINPSDIQVMDDNWVMEDSYLRSKAVFCFRSQYSATKVVLNIPFQITHLDESSKETLNNTYNCIKLITELDAYPFCFIKNQRIRTYISPTTMSATNFMMFAVDEIAIYQDAKASNMVFLEVVLQYFNYIPLAKDFEFRSNLSVDITNQPVEDEFETTPKASKKISNTLVTDIPPEICDSLANSAVWKRYMSPRVKKVFEELTNEGLLDVINDDTKSTHTMMGVRLLAPIMSVIEQGIENVDDGRYVNKDSKVITVANISSYDNGSFENTLTTLLGQDFTGDTVYQNQTKVDTINSERVVKQGETVSKKELNKNEDVFVINRLEKNKGGSVTNPFIDPKSVTPQVIKDVGKINSLKEAVNGRTYDNLKADSNNKQENSNAIPDPNVPQNSKDIFINWSGRNIEELDMGIQTIEVRKKNRLASHQISAYKHPVIQYMGKYPVSVNVTMASVNHDVYKDTEDYPTNTFIKQILNVLDYNRSAIPEAEAYNYLKIYSLATILMNCTSYLPAQSAISASSSSQGLENIVYSFNEGDLSAFIEQATVEASGKLSIDKGNAMITEIIIKWLSGVPVPLNEIIGGTVPGDNVSNVHTIETYKLIIELVKEAASELNLQSFPQYEALTSAISLSGDLKPNNNIVKKLFKIDSSNPKEFSGFTLYKNLTLADLQQGEDIGLARPQDYQRVMEERAKKEKEYPGATQVSVVQLHFKLIPFLIKILEIRQTLIAGGTSNIPNLSFTPKGKYNNLAIAVLSKIDAGLSNGEKVAMDKVNTPEYKDFLKQLNSNYSNSFFGYNLEDLELETLSPIKYNRATDILVPEIDPFFFLVEKQHLDGTEMFSLYNDMYADQGDNKDLLEHLNNTSNDEKDEADATTTVLGVTYRKLKEIDFSPPAATSANDAVYGPFNWSVLNAGKQGNASAKNVPENVIKAIEDALKRYGLENNQGFRQFMYSSLLKESTNGSRMTSPTGAVGLFQFTTVAVQDILEKSNKVITSGGNLIGSNLKRPYSAQHASVVKDQSKNDLFLNAQLFIERIQDSNPSEINKNGVFDPLYAYAYHNIGSGGLESVRAILEGRSNTLTAAAKTAIKHQSSSLIGGSDIETVQNYMKMVQKAMSTDNVPDSLKSTNTVSTNTSKVVNSIKESGTNLIDNAKEKLGFQNPKKSTPPLVLQKEIIEKASKEYTKAVKSPEDKANSSTIGVAIKGYVTKVKDGDTFVFVDYKTGKSYDIRVYGLDAPEIPHAQKGKESGEILGTQAAQALTDLLLNKQNVTVQFNGLDPYNRTIGKVTLPDGTDPALTMLRNGYGFVPENLTTIGTYKKAEEEAKKNQKGLWSYPAGVITKPRSNQQADLSGLSEADLAKLKNNVNYQKFNSNDLEYASKANSNPLNNFQPFPSGQTFKVTSPFGMRKHPTSGKYKLHNGVDFGCPVGTRIVAAASGRVTTKINSGGISAGYGKYIEIDHGNGFISLYGHLSSFSVANGSNVQAGSEIAKSGNTGTSTGPHLHYGVKYNGKWINPFGTKQLSQYKPGDIVGSGINTTQVPREFSTNAPELTMNRSGVNEENTVYNEDELARSIFKQMYKYLNVGLKASLPCIKVYVTVGNENDKFWLDTLKGGVQYYELKGIQSFHMNCNNDGNPIDTVFMTVADPSFLNTDGFMGLSKMQGVNLNAIGTDYETQFINNRLTIKPGTKLHIRCGYGSNPNKLDIVFNGTVVDVDSSNPQSLRLVCESYAKELLSELLATSKPLFLNNQKDNISTSSVIGSALVSRAVDHFGYNSGFWADKFRDSTDPEDRSLAPGRISFSYNLFFDFTPASYKSRLFMNVFAPEIEALDDLYNSYIGWVSNLANLFQNTKGGYPFAIYKMTPWDCLKQMEYRHPNTIIKPIMYEDRMSLFYGIKEQTCFVKDLTKQSQIQAAAQKDDSGGFDLTNYYGRRRERMAPAIGVHLITSNHNLINNGLRLNSQYSTATNVNYYVSEDASLAAKPWELDTFKMQFDDNLYPFDIREKDLTLSGCIGRYSAFLYGTTDLKKEAEKMYTGKILILGNPSIKAGDYAFIDDSEKRMHGMVLIRECYHHFDEKNGLVTEIVPGQYVEAANFMYSSLWIKLMCCSKVATSKLKTVLASNYSAEDFELVTDYLTVIHQVELALDKYDKGKADSSIAPLIVNGGIASLSLFLLNSLYRTVGASNKTLNLGTGIFGRFPKYFVKLYINQVDTIFLSKVGAKVALWADSNEAVKSVRGNIIKGKTIIGGSKFAEYYRSMKTSKSASGLLWRTAKPMLSMGAKAFLTGARVLSRVLFTSLMAFTFSNPLTIIIDAIAMFAVSWAFNKIQEEQLTRQPLLFFPIIKHGKPYTGGMAGVIRNTWLNSKLLEKDKTIEEVKKSAAIIAGNAEVSGKSNNLFVSVLNGIGNTSKAKENKVVMPLYENDENGNQLIVRDNRVTTRAEIIKFNKEEDLQKKMLYEKTNNKIINKALESRGDN